MKNFKLFLSLALFFTISCATKNHRQDLMAHGIEAPSGNYEDAIQKWTKEKKEYSGMSASFIVGATVLTTEIVDHQQFLEAEQFHRSPEQYKESRQKALFEAQSEVSFFVSLYTEKEAVNNLDKATSSWNIFLDSGGKRVSPKSIKRLFEDHTLLIMKYPYHNVWSKPYLIKFPINLNEVMGSKFTLTIAGTSGTAMLEYP